MARKRMRRRRADTSTPNQGSVVSFDPLSGGGNNAMVDGNGMHGMTLANVRILQTTEEGVLYTHAISERPRNKSKVHRLKNFCQRLRQGNNTDTKTTDIIANGTTNKTNKRWSKTPATPTLQGYKSAYAQDITHANTKSGESEPIKQYTIAPKQRFKSPILNWFDSYHLWFLDTLAKSNPDSHLYRPSMLLFKYINWTFHGTFTEVFMTFLAIYMGIMLLFAYFLLLAGNAQPACIVTSGEPFGANSDVDATRFSDAFALSWTTFTTVGYGMIYTSVGGDFHPNGPDGELATEPAQCTWVVFLCTAEAFLGLLYAGMCAAILFGKVNRVQSHANIIFSNSVCLQYEEVEEDDDYDIMEDDDDDVDEEEEDDSGGRLNISAISNRSAKSAISGGIDEESPLVVDTTLGTNDGDAFIDQFHGCPILKFQVVNEFCNEEGSEIVDAIMKVVGVKFKGHGDRITHSQYVRVNLVDFEHPFFSRVWHGVHILDASSPLLTDKARQTIQANNGSWPSSWFEHPTIIQEKLDFEDLILTVAGVSNVSAVTVHAYKRYKIGDVLIGYNFAPLVFRDRKTGILDCDLALANDVREQSGLPGEDLAERCDEAAGLNQSVKNKSLRKNKGIVESGGGEDDRNSRPVLMRHSTIRIKPSVSLSHDDALDMKLSIPSRGSSDPLVDRPSVTGLAATSSVTRSMSADHLTMASSDSSDDKEKGGNVSIRVLRHEKN